MRPAAAGVIAFLRGVMGLHTVMLTGDHEASAAKVARVLGLEKRDVFAGLKPEDKVGLAFLAVLISAVCLSGLFPYICLPSLSTCPVGWWIHPVLICLDSGPLGRSLVQLCCCFFGLPSLICIIGPPYHLLSFG